PCYSPPLHDSLPISSNLGADTFNDAIREAREDDAVKAVVLRIDSPGGSASASEAMRREIELTAAEKPVIVSMGSLAASGGYWIADRKSTRLNSSHVA